VSCSALRRRTARSGDAPAVRRAGHPALRARAGPTKRVSLARVIRATLGHVGDGRGFAARAAFEERPAVIRRRLLTGRSEGPRLLAFQALICCAVGAWGAAEDLLAGLGGAGARLGARECRTAAAAPGQWESIRAVARDRRADACGERCGCGGG